MNENNINDFWMKIALEEAQKAYEENEVPVGAVLINENEVIAKNHNRMEQNIDATAHAEILCLRNGMQRIKSWRLNKMTLYTTLEPCCLCAGAIFLSRISQVVWGAPDIRHGTNGSWIDLFNKKHNTTTINIIGGVLSENSSDLLKKFFLRVRNLKKK